MKNKLPLFLLCMFCLLAYGQRFVKVANTLAELALLNPNDIHTNAFVAGGAVAGDGNGGVFSYIRNSTTATTAVDVIKPVSYAGRWLRAIPGLNNTNGPGTTFQTIYTNVITITNHTDYVTNGSPVYITNGPTLITQNYQTNVNITNLFFNMAIRGTEQITGTNAVVNFTNQFLKRWILPGNSAPVFASVPSGTNETQVQVDVVQPVGAAYVISWPESINWRKNSGYNLLEQDTTNTFIFQWNGEGLSGWLVDGDANSAFLASGGLVQANGDAVDFVMTYDTWVDAQFNGGPFSVTITNNGSYAIYYDVDVQAANTQAVGVQIYDGTNTWPGLSGWVTVQSVEMPMTKIITTNVTTAPVTLTMQVYNVDGGMFYPNAYLVGTNAVLGYHLLGGSGSGGITYTTVTNSFNLTTGYIPYATSATTLGDSVLSTNAANHIVNPSAFSMKSASGTNVIYTPDAAGNYFTINNTNAQSAFLNLTSSDGSGALLEGYRNGGYGVASLQGNDDARLAMAAAPAYQVGISIDGFTPNTSGAVDLGNSTSAFRDVNVTRTVQITPYTSGISYTDLEITHNGTNGVIAFNSKANGDAGPPREFQFQIAGTAVAVISTNSGYTGAGTKALTDDGTYQTFHSGNTAYLAANATVADATFVNLSMSATVQNAKKYSFVLTLFCANSVPADGIKIDFEGGSATATDFRAHSITHDTALVGSQQVSALATDITVATITGDSEIVVRGSFEPSASGTFIPRFAENADTGGTLTVYRGSNLILTEIP